MSEWFKEHAWKSTPSGRVDAHQIPTTHSRIKDFRNIDARRRVPVNHRVYAGFRGVCDTVLTQKSFALSPVQQWYRSVSLRGRRSIARTALAEDAHTRRG